jgi:DNA repair photolyase
MTRHEQPGLFEDGPVPPQEFSAGGVTVRTTRCRSLLNRAEIDDYSFNCYTGCANGCAYCYARYMQRFHPHREPWGRFVDVKVNAAEVLARELRRRPAGAVFTSSACDGWQPVERHYRLTRECSRMLIEAGFRLHVLTKSELVLRDLDIFRPGRVCLGVTVTTADPALAQLWEPGASPVAARVRVLKEAKAAGLETAVMFGPLLPALSDTPDGLRALFALASEAGVDRVWTDALNPRPRVWPAVQALLRRHWPGLCEHYRRILFDPACRARYKADLASRVRLAADEAGMAGRLV